MNNKLVTLLLSSFLMALLWSCEKKENRIFFEGGTAPVLTASRSGNIPMAFATQDQEAIKLSWTNPNYQFTTGPSSQDVTYQVEIDTTGANFTNPNKKVLAINNDLSLSIKQSELNDYLLNQLQLKAGMSHNVEMRVKASLANNSVPLYSNVMKFTITPYAIPPKVTPPASGTLYVTGGATTAGWMAGGDAEVVSQKFTQVSPTLYVLPSVALKGGESYLLVPVYGNWDNKYGAIGANNSNNPDSDDFKAGGGDLKAPAASGNYKIEVDFQRGKYTLTKL
jgi:starch-binding outer membrane protein SusE/F